MPGETVFFEKFNLRWNYSSAKSDKCNHVFPIHFYARGHPLSTYAKFSEKLTFLTWYTHVRVRIRGLEMLVFRKMFSIYLMDDPCYCYSRMNLERKRRIHLKIYFHKGWYIYDIHFEGEGGWGGGKVVSKAKMRCYQTWGSWGLASVLDVKSYFFIINENCICAMTRHRAEPNINILLTRNIPSDSDDTQWSNPLMIPLYCLWAKSNNRTHGQFECDVTWFCFVFFLILCNCMKFVQFTWNWPSKVKGVEFRT